jgi:hypothetical protein
MADLHVEVSELIAQLDSLWPTLDLHELAVHVSDGDAIRIDVAHESPEVVAATEARGEYIRWLKHTKHLYARLGGGVGSLLTLMHAGRKLLPDMVALRPKETDHTAIDDNEIPRAVPRWTLVFHRTAPRVLPRAQR